MFHQVKILFQKMFSWRETLFQLEVVNFPQGKKRMYQYLFFLPFQRTYFLVNSIENGTEQNMTALNPTLYSTNNTTDLLNMRILLVLAPGLFLSSSYHNRLKSPTIS